MTFHSYTPPRSPGTALLFSSSALAAAAVLLFLSSTVSHRFLLILIAAAVLFLLSCWYLLRFGMISYRYEIRGDLFLIFRCIGKYSYPIFRLSLHLCCALQKNDEKRPLQCKERVRHFYNHTSSLTAADTLTVYYYDATVLCAVRIQTNDTFTAHLNEHICLLNKNDAEPL